MSVSISRLYTQYVSLSISLSLILVHTVLFLFFFYMLYESFYLFPSYSMYDYFFLFLSIINYSLSLLDKYCQCQWGVCEREGESLKVNGASRNEMSQYGIANMKNFPNIIRNPIGFCICRFEKI